MYWCDKEFDSLYDGALTESDETKRSEMYVEMQKLWDAAAHTVWLAWPTKHYAFRKGLQPALTPTWTGTPAKVQSVVEGPRP